MSYQISFEILEVEGGRWVKKAGIWVTICSQNHLFIAQQTFISMNSYRSRALKSRSKLTAAIGLGAAISYFFFYIKIQIYLL